jgi:hypothetical protein
MEVVKKVILQALKKGDTVPCTFRDPETGEIITGCTGTCYVLIPDLDAVYNFKIGLTTVIDDIGFFDPYPDYIEPPAPPVPPAPEETFYYTDNEDNIYTDSEGTYYLY